MAGTPARVKWVEEQNLHWTLKFLGDVDSNQIAEICQVAAKAVADLEPFSAVAHGAGAFPTAARPRTVWLGVADGEPEFVELHKALEKSLSKLGFRREGRRFRPHMTIGRVRRSPHGIEQLGEKIVENADFDAGEMRVSEIILFSSSLDRQGPTYQVLGRATLGGPN